MLQINFLLLLVWGISFICCDRCSASANATCPPANPGAPGYARCWETPALQVYKTINNISTQEQCCDLCASDGLCTLWMWYWTSSMGRKINQEACFLGKVL